VESKDKENLREDGRKANEIRDISKAAPFELIFCRNYANEDFRLNFLSLL
jgi:hypothetical protein